MLPQRIFPLAPAPRPGGAFRGSANASVGMVFRSRNDAAARAGASAFSGRDLGGRTLAGATRP